MTSDIQNSIKKSSDQNDSERVKYVKLIKLETNFFNVFRNTVRILLNDINYVSIRQDIESVVSSPYEMYYDKLLKISNLLRILLQEKLNL